MNLDQRQKMLGFLAIAAVALLVGDRLVLTPLTASWKARSERIAQLQRSVNQGSLLVDRERSIRARWENMQANTLVPEASAAEDQVLKAFERWSQDSRIGISSVKPQWRRNDEDYLTMECRVNASGSLSALTRFLYEIEKDPLALKADLVEITAQDDRGERLAMGLQVSGLLLKTSAPR